MGREKLIVILRWVGILPCALLALLLSYLLLSFFSQFPLHGDSWVTMYMFPILSAYVAGFAYMTIGILMAPSRNRVVAFILSAILLIILGIEVPSLISSKQYVELMQYAGAISGANIAYLCLKDAVQG